MTSLPANASPLRQRMIDDMRMRQLAPRTQDTYLHIVREFARFLGRSPGLGRLRHQPAQAKMHRAGLWLGQDGRPDSSGNVSGPGAGRAIVPADSGGLQPHAYAYARRQSGIKAQIGEEMTLGQPELRMSGIKSTGITSTQRLFGKAFRASVRCISTAC